MLSGASTTHLDIPLARTGLSAIDPVIQAHTEAGSYTPVAAGFRFAVNMTNAPFDLEASHATAKVQNITPAGYSCSAVVHSQKLRHSYSWRRRLIAGLLALVVCLAAVFVTVAVVRKISVKHRIDYIRCDVRGAHSMATLVSGCSNDHMHVVLKSGHHELTPALNAVNWNNHNLSSDST